MPAAHVAPTTYSSPLLDTSTFAPDAKMPSAIPLPENATTSPALLMVTLPSRA